MSSWICLIRNSQLLVLICIGVFGFGGKFARGFVTRPGLVTAHSSVSKSGNLICMQLHEIQIPRYSIVFVRHGESAWNNENIFTGWTDVPLTETGEKEATAAGQLMRNEGLEFDVVFTSRLKRAIKSAVLISDAMDSSFIPIHQDWRLNEQSYGFLEGKNKVECVKQYGLEQVQKWRRSYTDPPPARPGAKVYFPEDDPKYAGLTNFDAPDSWCGTPGTESLKDTQARAWRLWREEIAPAVRRGEKVLICAHGNTLRALLRRLDNIPNDLLMQLDIPRATPLVYMLDENLNPVKSSSSMLPLSGRFIGDAAELEAKVHRERTQCIPPPKKTKKVLVANEGAEVSGGSYMCPGF